MKIKAAIKNLMVLISWGFIFNICIFTILLNMLMDTSCKAQSQVDSLKKLFSTVKNDTQKMNILDELIECTNEDTIWLAFNEEMGRIAVSLSGSTDNKVKQAAIKHLAAYYNNLGYLQQEIGNSVQSLNHYLQGLKLFESVNDKTGTANTLINIGTIYHEQMDMVQAMKYFERSLTIMEQLNDTFSMAAALNNMGTVYNTQNNIEKALTCFEKSIALRKAIGDKEGLGITLTNIGGIYDKLNENEKALVYYNQSIMVQEEIGDEVGMALSQINFGNILLKKNKFAAAENHFLKSKKIAEKTGNVSLMLGASKWLSILYAAWGKYQPAFEMQSLYKVMTDSIRNDETRRQTLKKQIQFDYEKKETILKAEQEKKDALAREEITRQKIIRNGTAGGILLFMTSAMAVLVFYKRKNEAEMLHKITDSRMRAINSQMNPHFIFNCMHSIQSLVSKQDFESADNCLIRFAKLIRKVLDNSTQKEIALMEDIDTLRDYVELEKMRLEFPLTFTVNIDKDIEADHTLVPPLLLQPIIENAIIHGIKPKNAAGQITIDIKKLQKQLLIEISDNGIGRNPSDEKKITRKSYGIPLTRERLEYLGQSGKFSSSYKISDIYSENNQVAGTKVMITLPLRNEFD